MGSASSLILKTSSNEEAFAAAAMQRSARRRLGQGACARKLNWELHGKEIPSYCNDPSRNDYVGAQAATPRDLAEPAIVEMRHFSYRVSVTSILNTFHASLSSEIMVVIRQMGQSNF